MAEMTAQGGEQIPVARKAEAETIERLSAPERSSKVIQSLQSLWKDSVRATHHFLSENDIAHLTPIVREAIKEIPILYVACKRNETNGMTPIAFMGIAAEKIEMLFVAPNHFGQGIGKRLVGLAIQNHQAVFVDVNEQNPKAQTFYKHLGFEVFRRIATDGQGNPFPILEMKQKEIFLSTERLIIRSLRTQDIHALHAFMGKEEVMYAWEHGFTLSEVREWINRQIYRYHTDGMGYWGVALPEAPDALIGEAGLLKSNIDNQEVVELGYIFDSTYWHRGYAREATGRCLQYAFGHLELNEVYSTIRPTNLPSVRLAEGLGMIACGEYTKIYQGQEMPHLIYKITKEKFMQEKKEIYDTDIWKEMMSGHPYFAPHPLLTEELNRVKDVLHAYNVETRPSDSARLTAILEGLLGYKGEDVKILPPSVATMAATSPWATIRLPIST